MGANKQFFFPNCISDVLSKILISAIHILYSEHQTEFCALNCSRVLFYHNLCWEVCRELRPFSFGMSAWSTGLCRDS